LGEWTELLIEFIQPLQNGRLMPSRGNGLTQNAVYGGRNTPTSKQVQARRYLIVNNHGYALTHTFSIQLIRWELETQMAGIEGLNAVTAHNSARAVHALTEGLATMELRSAFATAAEAEVVWRSAVHALVTGLALDGVGAPSQSAEPKSARPTLHCATPVG
jgi:hypothetical protein